MRYGEETFGYNLNAEMISRTIGDDVTTYGWSPFGNLEQVMLPDGTEISYELDPTGRRVGRSVDGERTHGWIYRDHLNPVAQLDADGRLEQVYLYGTQPHAPDAILEIGAGGAVVSTYRVVTDVRGSVRLVVNADTGAVVQELRYSPFGEVLHDSNPGFQPFGFAGGLWDADTGLVRFGAREYDGRLGRWLSRDPILFNGGDPNLFGYVLGDPVNWVDPEGLWAFVIGAAVVGVVGYGIYDFYRGLDRTTARRRACEEAFDRAIREQRPEDVWDDRRDYGNCIQDAAARAALERPRFCSRWMVRLPWTWQHVQTITR